MTVMGGRGGVKALPRAERTLFRDYRVLRYEDSQIIHGLLHPWVAEDDPDLRSLLSAWPGRAYVAPAPQPAPAGGLEVVLVRDVSSRRVHRWLLSGTLFLLTLFTTLTAGALLRGVDPLATRALPGSGGWIPVPTTVDWEALLLGAPFSFTFVGILLAHELGHFVAARWHRIRTSLPYFIPVPAYFTVVGTLGAFIRIRSPIVRPHTLLDVGAAGPVASFLLSVPAVGVGLALSTPVEGGVDPFTPYLIEFAGQAIWLGDGLLLRGMALAVTGGSVGSEGLLLHPVAFAGWLGLFVTFLNLLPLGQLDGGHVAHALVGSRQRWAGGVFLLLLVPMGLVWWGWWFWGLVALALGRGKLSHPGLVQDQVPLDPARRRLGWSLVAVFVLILPPVPVAL